MTAPARTVINMRDLRDWTREAHANGEEACGLVIGDTAFPLPNEAETPEGDFVIGGPALTAFFQEHPGFFENWNGVWHSHPSNAPLPSANDVAWHPMGKSLLICTDDALHGYIVAPRAGEVSEDGVPDAEGVLRKPFGFSEMWRDTWPV